MPKTGVVLTVLCLVLTSASFSTGCESLYLVVGSGRIVSQDFSLGGFSRISANWTFDVEVSQGLAYRVNVTVDENLLSYLEVTRDGDTLKLEMKKGYAYSRSHLKAIVNMPHLSGMTLSGASEGKASGFSLADDFILNVSGASQASLESMVVNKLTMDISGASRANGGVNASGKTSLHASGASTIEINGKGIDADIKSSGASTVNLTNYSVRDAHVNVSGASNATVDASGTLSGDVSGASHLYYTGAPTLGTIHTSGASSVNKK
jgi:hypothetical protein